jgi:hypothetical protein
VYARSRSNLRPENILIDHPSGPVNDWTLQSMLAASVVITNLGDCYDAGEKKARSWQVLTPYYPLVTLPYFRPICAS